MAEGRLQYTTDFFTFSALLLFGLFFHDVEASSCQHDIHKKVGDTVEISSCLPTEGVVMARWKYGSTLIADKDTNGPVKQFKGRLDFNPTNFSLTLRGLTLKDSGEFSFSSALNGQQRETVTITLHVHEPITEEPVVSSNFTWHPLNQSCTVFLTCSAASHSNVIYRWAVKNQNINGSSLNNIIMSQDEDTNFTCTVSNVVSEKSTSKVVTCSNSTSDPPNTVSSSSPLLPLIIGPIIGILLIILLLLLLVFCKKSKGPCFNRLTQSQMVNQDETQQHVYSSLLHGDSCVYETMRGSEDVITGGPPNIYNNVTSPSVHLHHPYKQSDDCVYEEMRGSEEALNDL